jgi:hypothetical protein
MKLRVALLLFPLLFATQNLFAAATQLTLEERDRLRYRLETLFNEQDLLIRNRKVNQSDVARQQKEFETLKVFERIPFHEDTAELKNGLLEHAREYHLEVLQIQTLPRRGKAGLPIPQTVYSDTRPIFRLTPDQLVEEIPFWLVIKGEKAEIQNWVGGWRENLHRLSEIEGEPTPVHPGKAGKQAWKIQAHAFRFRDIKYPTLIPRDPVERLPTWARKNPEAFAKAEPLLWCFVTRTRAITSEARPLYRTREQLILNNTRMSFFISKAVPPR